MNELRKNIIQRYCRSAIWIDDEILDDQIATGTTIGLDRYFGFFVRVAREFQEEGVLCSLKSFPQISVDDDDDEDRTNALEACKKLALKAEIIIIDWMLGATSPDHCLNILEHVIKSAGNRFIIILSKEESVAEKFDREFNDFSSGGLGWRNNNNGIFVAIQNKEDFEGRNANTCVPKKLLDEIFTLMADTYKDYLHWTALEIAANIKEITPQWLSSLPEQTDLGLLAEHIHSRESVKETVFENLMDDLRVSLEPDNLSCLSDKYLDANKWPEKERFIALIAEDIKKSQEQENLRSKVEKLIPCCITDTSPDERKKVRNNLREHTKKLKKHIEGKNMDSIERFLRESELFSEFCEKVSLPPLSCEILKRGSIFSEDPNTDINKIWVCISQSCDCVRSSKLMFLEGQKVDTANEGTSNLYIRFNGSLFEFPCDPRTLAIENIEEEGVRHLEGKKCFGYLRRDIVDRLAGKYWAHITRVGINIPILERSLRPKEV